MIFRHEYKFSCSISEFIANETIDTFADLFGFELTSKICEIDLILCVLSSVASFFRIFP